MAAIRRKWEPHPAQAQILHDGHRFRTVAAGRRFGKTRMARNALFEFAYANPGAECWFVAPSHGDAKELGFEAMRDTIPDALQAGIRESVPPQITLPNQANISFRSADGKTRGRGLDFIVVDECGEIPNKAWKADLRPSLSDTGGAALFIGTPKGRDWFWDNFKRGRSVDYDEWASFQFSTYDNPYVPDKEVELARAELPERVFQQEYLAEFLEDEGAVFGDVTERNGRRYDLDAVAGTSPYTIGVDLARKDNWTVAIALDSEGMVVDFGRWQGGSWAAMGRHLEQFINANSPATVYMDATRDNKIIEDLDVNTPKASIKPVTFNASNKSTLIENLAARLETQDIVLPDDLDVVIEELTVYQYDTTPSGNITYGPPEGFNDDAVDALALAAKKTTAGRMSW